MNSHGHRLRLSYDDDSWPWFRGMKTIWYLSIFDAHILNETFYKSIGRLKETRAKGDDRCKEINSKVFLIFFIYSCLTPS